VVPLLKLLTGESNTDPCADPESVWVFGLCTVSPNVHFDNTGTGLFFACTPVSLKVIVFAYDFHS